MARDYRSTLDPHGATDLLALDCAPLQGVTAGTAAPNKAVVLDASGDTNGIRNITRATGAVDDLDSGTATASSSAATVSKQAGVVTSEALTTAAGAAETLTITNTLVAAGDIVMCSVKNGTNTQGIPVVGAVTPGTGSFTVKVWNLHATEALNGTVKVTFLVCKA